MRTDWNENRALLIGEAIAQPDFSHENHGEDYFRFPLEISRLSGSRDVVNVIASRALLEDCPVMAGVRIRLAGEVRSFNNKNAVGSRLVITAYARSLIPTDEPDANQLTLAGVLCKTPIYRRTPLGREICDLMLAVNRRYGRADYLPCIAWGVLARTCARMSVGEGLRLEGRLQSREYTKVTNGVGVRRIAYEISIMSMSPALGV